MIRKNNRLRLLCVAAIGLLLQGIVLTAEAAPTFSVTPYLQHPATNAMTILFFTTENCQATVKVWRADGTGETNSVTTTGTDVSGTLGATQHKHRVRLENLRTYTDYLYDVTLTGGVSYGNGFRTFPGPDTPVRFIGYSDCEVVPMTGKSTDDKSTWANHTDDTNYDYYPVDRREGYASNIVHMVSRQPDLMFIAGDIVASGGAQANWNEFWYHNAGKYNDPAGSIPLLATIGNHDLKEGSSVNSSTGGEPALEKYLTYFEYNSNDVHYTYSDGTTKAETRDLSQLFHREDVGPVTLIFLDTNKGACGSNNKTTTQTGADRPPMRSPDFHPGTPQYTWLTNNLADAQRNSKFTFVINHHCPYDSGKFNKGESECSLAVRSLTSAMMQYGVDGWLCGHDELQEHSQTNGWEVLPGGGKRQHTLNIYALGSGGDTVKHDGSATANPLRAFLAYEDDPDVWEGGVLKSGGCHYGHIEVDVTTNKNGKWMCSLTPAYVFVTNDKTGAVKNFQRCCYKDRVIIEEESDEIVWQESTTNHKGEGVPADYVEYVRPAQAGEGDGEPVVPDTVVVTTSVAEGNGTVTPGGEYEIGANVTLTATAATGYRFTKWTVDDANESTDNPLVLNDLRRSARAAATFKANKYGVVYDPNGGSGEIEAGEAAYDTDYDTAACTFAKAGYVCTGWGTNGTDGLVFVCKPGEKALNLTAEHNGEVTLHAMWEPIAYALSYSSGGAGGEAVSTQLVYDVEHTVVACPFEWEDHEFVGWLEGETLHQPGEVVSNLTATAGAVVTWTATWEETPLVPTEDPETVKDITLGVGETVVLTNRYRRNLRFWLLGKTSESSVATVKLNIPTVQYDEHVGYACRSSFKTNEVVVTVTGKAPGTETVSFGRQYNIKKPVHAVSYRITVNSVGGDVVQQPLE